MAAIVQGKDYAIAINGDGLQFGCHFVPIQTIESFWVWTKSSNPSVHITLGSLLGSRHAHLQLQMLTSAKVKELSHLLFEKTKATFTQQFFEVCPTVQSIGKEKSEERSRYRGQIEFLFWTEQERDNFYDLAAPLFARQDFQISKEAVVKIKFTATEEGIEEQDQVERINQVLKNMCLKISHCEVQKRLNQNHQTMDPRFAISDLGIKSKRLLPLSLFKAQRHEKSYILSPQGPTRESYFSEQGEKWEILLANTESIWQFLKEEDQDPPKQLLSQ